MAKEKGSENGTDLTKLKGDARVAEALKTLGYEPEEMSGLAYTIWSPWKASEDPDHAEDPIAFKAIYEGYKLISKELNGKLSTFGGFLFREATPSPKNGGNWIVLNKILVGDLGRVIGNTEVAIVYAGSKPNVHGGQTRDVRASVRRDQRAERVSNNILPPMNLDVKMLSGGREVGADDVEPSDAPFGA